MPRSYLNRSASKVAKAEREVAARTGTASKGKAPEKDKERAKVLGKLRNFSWSKQWESAYRTLPSSPWRHKRKQTLNAGTMQSERRRSSYDHRHSVSSVHYPHGESTVFGVPLAQLVLESNSQVPFLVSDIVTFLSSHGLKEEGLFRVSGNARIIDKIRCRIEEDGCPVDFSPFRDDMAAVASILKLFLRELPDAVVSTSVHALFIRAQADNEQDADRCVWQLRDLISALPDAERDLLVYLCGFLRTVADHVDTTKMTAKALGIVFGPNIFRCAGGLEGLKEQAYTNHIVEKFIAFHADIFTYFNFSSVPTSSCDSLDDPRPASADPVLRAEHPMPDVICPPRLSHTPDGRCVDSSSRRQSLYRQRASQVIGSSAANRQTEYHINHPNLCGVSSNPSSSGNSNEGLDRTAIQPMYQPDPIPKDVKNVFEFDVSPRRDVLSSRYRYSAVLPGRVRNVVDRWETVDSRSPGGFEDEDLSSCDESQAEQYSRYPPSLFSRNMTRRPRVAIPSVFLGDSKRKIEDRDTTPGRDGGLSPPNFSIPATSLLDDIIKLLETPVKTSGETSAVEAHQDHIRDVEDSRHAQSHGETTDSGFKSLESIPSGERQRYTASGRQDGMLQRMSPSFSSGHGVEAIALSAGAHVQRARSVRSEARAARKQFSPLVQQDTRVVTRQQDTRVVPRQQDTRVVTRQQDTRVVTRQQSRRSPLPYTRSSSRQLQSTVHGYRVRQTDSDSSERGDETEATVDIRASPLRTHGLHRRNARAASFRQPPVVVSRSPKPSLVDRRRVQSLPPLELADDSDTSFSEASHYIGKKRKHRQQDDVQLDADLLQLLRDLQHSHPLSSNSSARHSKRDSMPAEESALASAALQARRSSTPRSNASQSTPLNLRCSAEDYANFPLPSPMLRGRRTSSSSKAARSSYDPGHGFRDTGRRPSQEQQITQVVKYIAAKLSMKRTLACRPSDFKDMTADQLLAEKKNIQKCLLQYEAQFGRPSLEAERKLMRPLYEQYRAVKHYMQLANCSTKHGDIPLPELALARSARQSSGSLPGLGSPARHGKQTRSSSHTYVESYMAGGMVPPTPPSHNVVTGGYGTSHIQHSMGFSPSGSHMKFLHGGMLAASAAVPVGSPMAFSTPTLSSFGTHGSGSHVVQTPLWWTTSLQKANRAELLDLQLQVLLEKGQLRRLLKTFEDEFYRHTGRKLMKQDRGRMAAEYDRYKYCKAQLKLLDALLSKPSTGSPQTTL